MTIIESIVLGFIQSITVFLPVSFQGHIMLVRSLFGIQEGSMLAFGALSYFAIIFAIIVYFFSDIWQLTQAGLRKLGKLPVNKRDETLLYALGIAAIPAVVLGLTLESFIKQIFKHPLLIAILLVAGSVLFMYAEWVYRRRAQINIMTPKIGFKIGLFQVLSIIPGLSGAGAAISGGILLGLSRSEAARFAFLVAVPVLLSAGLKKFLDFLVSSESAVWSAVLSGAIVSFIVALFAIHFMVSFVRTHTLWPFIWYRIILAFFVVSIYFLG